MAARNALLKACIFATGLAGIVAEYIMATLASYLMGDSVRQWTLTISLMLFAMGLGSRLSRRIRRHLLDAFVTVELLLSLLCASAALATYLLAAWVEPISLVIYPLAVAIGLLIGLEMPLATRLNDYYEELRINVSSVMEKDYYGALLGGLIFAFLALPYLGLTYTPIMLGTVNFAVAAALFLQFRQQLNRPRLLSAAFAAVPVVLLALAYLAQPIVLFGEQSRYRDLVVYEEQTPYQKIVMTRWQDDHWLYLNGAAQFSSYDEERYHEPLVHPAMEAAASRRRVLILGGGDGLAAREVLKHPEVESLRLVDLDPAVTRLARTHPVLRDLNEGSLDHPKVEVVNQDAYAFLDDTSEIFDVIIIDLPDPKSVELARLYSVEFYRLAGRHLSPGGTLVTQAASPLFARRAFLCIYKTLGAAGFSTAAMHNHVPTMGEWGWVLGVKGPPEAPGEDSDSTFGAPIRPHDALRERLLQLDFQEIPTRYLDREALHTLLYFGKDVFRGLDSIQVNRQMSLVLKRYYQEGDWDLY
ncbi:MAG TPA: polyamine aminopropyltransferase [Acidobacteriota bacterium]|nr:polyamine aminopropyltransferase [Acidobacteriota bacterium]